MKAVDLYLCLAVATAVSVLVSLSVHRRVRLIRNATVLLSYIVLVLLFLVEPWWRIVAVWGLAGLLVGVFCFGIDCVWNHRSRFQEVIPPASANWWIIPLGLLGWPDMLPQTLELLRFDHWLRRLPPTR